ALTRQREDRPVVSLRQNEQPGANANRGDDLIETSRRRDGLNPPERRVERGVNFAPEHEDGAARARHRDERTEGDRESEMDGPDRWPHRTVLVAGPFGTPKSSGWA